MRDATHPARVLFLLLVALPAQAQEQEQLAIKSTGDRIEVELAGHRLTMPLPMWAVESDVPVDQANIIYNEVESGVDSLLLLPLDSTVVTWKQLMGALVVHRPGYKAAAQVQSIVERCRRAARRACSRPGPCRPCRQAGANGFLLLCGRYKPTVAASTRNCAAGIVIGVVMETTEGAAKVYLEWCTASFNPKDKASWPLPEPELVQYAANLQAKTRLEALVTTVTAPPGETPSLDAQPDAAPAD
ncbi:MAG: hypothetical protein WDN31_11725 [Hyphomicrobium sp.]